MIIKQDDVTDDTKFRGALSKEIDKQSYLGIDYTLEDEGYIWEIDDDVFNEKTLNNIETKFINTYPKGCKEFIKYFRIYLLLNIDIFSVQDMLDNWRIF